MELGSGPPLSFGSGGSVSPIFNTEDPKEAAAGAACFGLVGGVLGGVTATVGTAAVVISLPGILAGIGIGAGAYGTGLAVKWTFKSVKNLLKS
jgi:hypothetical protein